jgi:hypothetical protein
LISAFDLVIRNQVERRGGGLSFGLINMYGFVFQESKLAVIAMACLP